MDEALAELYGALVDDDPETLYERAPCGYLSTAPDGLIIKVNQTFLSWTGYTRSDLVGRRTFAELLTAGGRIYHETHYAPMLQMQGTAREIALDIVRADGRRLPALVNSVLERDPAGAPVIIRTAVFDATERRGYERELLRAKQRAEESELRARLLVHTLQQALIPPEAPEIPGLDLSAAYRPAGAGDEVGGDFYDVFQLGADDWVIVVGDVRGKGAEAAVVTAFVRYTVRAAAVRSPQPSQVLGAVNEALIKQGADRFCTVALLRLRREGRGWAATVCLAGHPLPIHVRQERPQGLGRPGMLLGSFEDPFLHDHQADLHSGDALIVYTDGVTEARRGREFYGEQRLEDAVAREAGSARALTNRIMQQVLEFQAHDPRDDIVIVVLRVP